MSDGLVIRLQSPHVVITGVSSALAAKCEKCGASTYGPPEYVEEWSRIHASRKKKDHRSQMVYRRDPSKDAEPGSHYYVAEWPLPDDS